MNKWLLFNAKWVIFQLPFLYIMERKVTLWRDDVCFALDQHADIYGIIPLVDMSLCADTLYWFRANQSLLFLINAVWAANSNYNCLV